MRPLLALTFTAFCHGEWHNTLGAWPASLDGEQAGHYVAEQWGTNNVWAESDGISITGNNRLYMASNNQPPHSWNELSYLQLPLLNRELSFTADLSAVGCGCNAAVYLVSMQGPQNGGSGYCDITTSPPCLEIDLLEGNTKAYQASLHTTTGVGIEDSCNKWGCSANVGKHPTDSYGPHSHIINSSKPFTVQATFRETSWKLANARLGGTARGALFDLTLTQGDDSKRQLHLFDAAHSLGSHSPNGAPLPIPNADLERTRDALAGHGMALVVSLWTTGDLSWLDGGCATQQRCNINSAKMAIRDLRVGSIPSPPLPPPPVPPPSHPPPMTPPPPRLPPGTPPPLPPQSPQSPPSPLSPFTVGAGYIIRLTSIITFALLISFITFSLAASSRLRGHAWPWARHECAKPVELPDDGTFCDDEPRHSLSLARGAQRKPRECESRAASSRVVSDESRKKSKVRRNEKTKGTRSKLKHEQSSELDALAAAS